MRKFEFSEKDTQEAIDLANRLLAFLGGTSRVKCEVALLIAYTAVAEGCNRYPAGTKEARINMVLSRGSTALAGIVEEVGAMPNTAFLVPAN
jgi:hypothetical protein